MPKTETIAFRIDSELKKKAQELAKKDGRSLSNWLEQMVRKEVEKNFT